MRTYRSASPSEAPEAMDMAEYERRMKEQVVGHDPLGEERQAPPGPTHSTPYAYGATAQRCPYLPAEQLREPTLGEGVSFRQKID